MEDIKAINEYLEKAKNLEVSLYTQKKILHTLSNRIKNLKTKKNISCEPTKPTPLSSPSKTTATFIKSFLHAAIIPALLFIAWTIYILISPALTTMPQVIFSIILGVLFALICAFVKTSIEVSKNNTIFKEKMISYEQKLKSYHDSNEKENDRLKKVNLEREYLSLQFNELENTFRDTQETIKAFYNSSNLVYPKYLNLLGVTQILEYLQSGRCDTLIGPHGAYNLYESELRMNRIINNLDQIIYHLEEIKENQYLIYQELCRGNDIAEKILDEITYSNASLRDIEINSAVAAYNSQVTSYNSSVCAFNTSF